MRVFMTGASGFIGSAIVRELLVAGHQVSALARSEPAAAALGALGVQVQRGSLQDLDGLHHAAAQADGVIHTAFGHDFTQYASAGETDRAAVAAMGAALAGTERPFVITSGVTVLAAGQLATEAGIPDPHAISAIRIPSERVMGELAASGVRTSVIRLPPSVHGHGDHGFVPALIATARKKGVSAYVGDGMNRWPAVHRLDAALLFRLALERAPAGAVLHGVADEGVPFKDIAERIARRLKLPTVALAANAAAGHFDWLGQVVAADLPASATTTRSLLDWRPRQLSLLRDLERGSYFAAYV